MRKIAIEAGVVLAICLVLLAFMGLMLPAELLVNLAVGWAAFLYRVLPGVTVGWSGVVTAVACLLGLAVGLQLFCRWVYQQVQAAKGADGRPPPMWPVRWTGAIVGVVVVMFLAGIAAAGITHQIGWLLTSPEPLIDNSFRDVAARLQSSNNLRYMALAMLEYHDRQGALPTSAAYDREGRPLLSWRVLVLPYLEEETLYSEFRLDEPWDSPHNLRLLVRIPKVYVHPVGRKTALGYTHYQVFVGKGAAFEGRRGLHIPADFPDGAGNTILIVEAAEAVPWTKPADLCYEPDEPLPPLGGLLPHLFNVALGDASVRSLGHGTSEQTLRAAITRNGGDQLGPDW
jgi:hypothetical protein